LLRVADLAAHYGADKPKIRAFLKRAILCCTEVSFGRFREICKVDSGAELGADKEM
jgi:hypothetical protein